MVPGKKAIKPRVQVSYIKWNKHQNKPVGTSPIIKILKNWGHGIVIKELLLHIGVLYRFLLCGCVAVYMCVVFRVDVMLYVHVLYYNKG